MHSQQLSNIFESVVLLVNKHAELLIFGLWYRFRSRHRHEGPALRTAIIGMFDDGVVGGGGWKTVCRLPERGALGSAFLCLSSRYMFLLYAGFRNIDLDPGQREE